MRFLMLNWRDPENPLSGGAERVSLAHLAALVKRGHGASWFANGFPGAKPETLIEGIQVVRGGGKGTSVLKARAWFRRQKPFDLVIDQHHGIPWFAPWWCGTNCIAYIHEVLGPIWNSFYPWPLSWIGQLQERWTHRFYRNVQFWTVSESTRKQLLAHGVHEVKVLPNGVDTRPLPSLDVKPLSSPLRLMAVSRLAPNKRVDHAIHALKCLAASGVEAELTVVGTGEVEGDLRRLALELQLGERVRFTGKLDEEEKNRELQRAHLLLHTSQREGWGLNVIEANCMGTPAVVYPVGGLVDSTVSGVSGWIAAAESPEAMARCLAKISISPQDYDRIRAGAWERSKKFQWEEVLPAACDWLESQARGGMRSG
jgi:glycosyltransferase involved in cell wall biosynthesis